MLFGTEHLFAIIFVLQRNDRSLLAVFDGVATDGDTTGAAGGTSVQR